MIQLNDKFSCCSLANEWFMLKPVVGESRMKVEIICPLYNAADCILKLHESLLAQKNVEIAKISYALTESRDNTEEILKSNNIPYSLVKKAEFSHSLTRENIAMRSENDILVFVTQDVEIVSENWLFNLVSPIINGQAAACYSRQISKYNNLEKYTREKNYPKDSSLVSKANLEKLGLRTFFFSDASSAIKTDIFKQLNGYDQKNLPISEDMYIAYKIIMAGYSIKYCADSVVYHSHKFTLKQLYCRYYLTGMFMAQNSYLDQYGTTQMGGGMAKYILKRALQQFNLPVLFRFIPDMVARWLGMKNGKKAGRGVK